MFALEFTASALDDLRYLRRFEQSLILDAIERQLTGEPLTPTRNRTPLRPNDLAAWERRIEKYRVFYDVNAERYLVKVKAVGWKDRDRLIIRGREFVL